MARNFGLMTFSRGEVIAFRFVADDYDGDPLTDAGTTVDVVISESRGSAELVNYTVGNGVTAEDQSAGLYLVAGSVASVAGLTSGVRYSLVVWSNYGTSIARLQHYGQVRIASETQPS